jgi:DNA-binding transcriptional MerR regulator
MEQMMERLLAKTDYSLEEIKAAVKAYQEKDNQEKIVTKMEANLEGREANEDKLETNQEKIEASVENYNRPQV